MSSRAPLILAALLVASATGLARAGAPEPGPAAPDRRVPGRPAPDLDGAVAPGSNGASPLLSSSGSPGGSAPPGAPARPTLDPALATLLEDTPRDARVPVLLRLAGAVPRASLERLVASPAPRAAVVARLRAASALSRRPLAPLLDALAERGALARVRPVWIAHAVAVDATPAAIRALAAHAAVEHVRHLPRRDAFAGRPGRPARAGARAGRVPSTGLGSAPGSVDWGTRRIGAERVTREIGLTGHGVAVAVIDSGVCWRHPDIAGRVRVNPGEDLDGDRAVMDEDDLNDRDDDGNGYVDDLIGWDVDDGDNDPDDVRSGHGSHVAGSVAGDGSSGYRAGVAPGASILPIRVGTFSGDEADAWRGIEYALVAGADVINLSMGWRHVWGADRATWRRVIDAVVAAGVPFVVAAGNEGWDVPPGSVRSPGDVPAAITVGSTDVRDALAVDSSIGPVTWEGVAPYGDYPLPVGLLKPDFVAPGVDVASHARCDGTVVDSGTSMATPHVAGTIALLLEADPTLDVGAIRELLRATAVDLGPPGPDNAFGHGLVDAFAAVDGLNGRLRHGGHAVRDEATGNGSGALDPGETAGLSVTLVNASPDRAATLRAVRLVSETDGLVVERDAAFYPTIPPGGARAPDGPLPLVRSTLPCGAAMTLRLEIEHADGRRSRTRFTLRSGAPVHALLVQETFEGGAEGWTVEGDADEASFVLTTIDGRAAFATGGADGDVDGGEARLVSPAWDASRFRSLSLAVERAARVEGEPVVMPDDPAVLLAGAPFDVRALAALADAPVVFVIEVSDDDGRSWIPVEIVTRDAGRWRRVRRPLGAIAAFSEAVRVRVRVADASPAAEPSASDDRREARTWGALGAVRLEGERLECAPPR